MKLHCIAPLSWCQRSCFLRADSIRRRLDSFLDPEPREEIGETLAPVDPLKFKDSKKYKDRITQAQKLTGEKDALVVMRGQLKGLNLVAAAFEFSFMGGSMGSVVGERFVQGVNISLEQAIPMVCFSASGMFASLLCATATLSLFLQDRISETADDSVFLNVVGSNDERSRRR